MTTIETAIATIIASTVARSDERVRGTGQVAIISAVLSTTVTLFALTLIAGERGIAIDELRTKILAPMVRRGFVRVNRDNTVTATAALAAHSDPFGAWMAGDRLRTERTVKHIVASQLQSGDVLDLGARMVLVGEVEKRDMIVYAGPMCFGRNDRVRVYRAA